MLICFILKYVLQTLFTCRHCFISIKQLRFCQGQCSATHSKYFHHTCICHPTSCDFFLFAHHFQWHHWDNNKNGDADWFPHSWHSAQSRSLNELHCLELTEEFPWECTENNAQMPHHLLWVICLLFLLLRLGIIISSNWDPCPHKQHHAFFSNGCEANHGLGVIFSTSLGSKSV